MKQFLSPYDRGKLVLLLVLFASCETLDFLHKCRHKNGNCHPVLSLPIWEKNREDSAKFDETKRLSLLRKFRFNFSVREIFYFSYESYMRHAYPLDELNPIYCTGRGPDYADPSNININDVLGNYSLTLLDSLDTLAVLGNVSEFRRAAKLIIDNVSFNVDSTVQVFEANIRVLGALLSSHLLITDASFSTMLGHGRSSLVPDDGYSDELLHLAKDIARRLLDAFTDTSTGLPLPRVNLLPNSPPAHCSNLTCTAAAGSLLLEFSVLSRLTGDEVFERAARASLNNLWRLRSRKTGLFGNVIDVETGQWAEAMSGLGAGMDSVYEYLLKGSILFGDGDYLNKFRDMYSVIKRYLRRGRRKCSEHARWPPPFYVNVNMDEGSLYNYWIDSLQAAWPAVLTLYGDVEEAICQHAIYYAIWRHYGVLPERFNWRMGQPDVKFYPLRPEFAESTYFLYRATKNPFYLEVGEHIVSSIEQYTKAKCGYATVHNVFTMELEDRMESFFLSETLKYLYLLFDVDHALNGRLESDYVFSTEGHLFPVKRIRSRPKMASVSSHSKLSWRLANHSRLPLSTPSTVSPVACENIPRFGLSTIGNLHNPNYIVAQYEKSLGLD